MKRIITVVLALVASVSSWAQITIDITNASNFSSVVGRDVVYGLNLGSSTLPSLTSANNATWDLTNLVYNNALTKPITRLSALSPYKFGDSVQRTFGAMSFLEQEWNLLTTTGIITYASVMDTQTLFIPRTSLAPDTFAITSQKNALTSGGYTKIPFPLTTGTAWKNNVTYSSYISITDTTNIDTFHNANATVFCHIISSDSVCGWGKMRIKRPTGDTTQYFNVLQVRSTKIEKDSFYIKGAGFPAHLLTLLGITQGNVIKSYRTSFYRAGRLTPLARFTFSDSTYSTVIASEIDTNISVHGTGVNEIPTAYNDIKIYPNPVVNHTFTVEIPESANGSWSYDIIGINGQVVSSGQLAIDANNNRQQINLPYSIMPGVYYMRIISDGALVSVKALDINK